MTALTDDEIAAIEQKYLTRYNAELGRLVADLKAARAALRMLVNIHISPIGTIYELPRVISQARAALPASPEEPPR